MKMKKNKDKQAKAEETGAEVEAENTPETPETPETPVDAQEERAQDQLKRAMADLQNIRKRHVKEMDDARKRAVEGLATELLPVLDNFDLALAAHQSQADDGSEAVVEGVRMVKSLLHGVLERHGLAEVPAEGVAFDPNVHEAVGVDAESDAEPGHVTRVMLTGYTMEGRVIRPAKVFVSGNAETQDAPEN